jgi:hypothetical protein
MKILRAVARHLGALLARTVLFIVAAAIIVGALFWFSGGDISSWISDRPEVIAALIIAAAVVVAAAIVADSRGSRAS